MKQRVFLLLAACLLLSGCGGIGEPVYPEKAADGSDWDENWTMHGSVLGIEGGEPFTLLENYAVLTMRGISTSVWGVGQPARFVNEKGEEEENWYDAQVYALVKECAGAAEAEAALDEWAERLGETWTVGDVWEESRGGLTYTVRSCESAAEERQYGRELAAFACYGSSAVCVELDLRDTYTGDEAALLSAFLDRCHYNAEA